MLLDVGKGLRCSITGNLVGTDTVKQGYVCPCNNCQKYKQRWQKLKEEIDRQKEEGLTLDLEKALNKVFKEVA